MSSDDRAPSPQTLIFAHGAKGSTKSREVVEFCNGFEAAKTHRLIKFDSKGDLHHRTKHYQSILSDTLSAHSRNVILGGRSIGARAAVCSANSLPDRAWKLVLVSWPLRTDLEEFETREKLLLDLRADCEVLFILGTRDWMCTVEELQGVREKMAARSWLVEVEGGDHFMALKGVPSSATEAVGMKTGSVAAEWVAGGFAGREGINTTVIRFDKESGIATWSGDRS